LLKDLVGILGRRFFDLLVGDALYLQAPLVKAVEEMGFDWVFNLKANQPELLAEAERVTGGQPERMVSGPEEELLIWDGGEAYWPAADRAARVVKTVRRQSLTRVAVQGAKGESKRRVKEKVVEEATNFYASNLGDVSPFFLHQVGRSRWSIDTEVFQVMAKEGNLKRPSIHQGCYQALVVLTMIRLLAYLLAMVFYHRQVCSHFSRPPYGFSDLARRFAYWFVAAHIDSS
jgi:hypothetical protein